MALYEYIGMPTSQSLRGHCTTSPNLRTFRRSRIADVKQERQELCPQAYKDVYNEDMSTEVSTRLSSTPLPQGARLRSDLSYDRHCTLLLVQEVPETLGRDRGH